MKASIKDIAARAGTSVSTVSRALNKSGYVSPDVRARVEEAVRDLNYTPSKDARMMRGAPSRVVGLMLPAVDVPFFGILAQAIEQALFQKGYQTLICCTSENLDHEMRYVSMLLSQRVDGVIVASAFGDDAHFEAFVEAGVPLVAIDRDLGRFADHVVTADHEAGGRLMVRHLAALGHRRIGVIGAPAHSQSIKVRLQSIRDEMVALGLEPAAVALGEEHTFAAAYDRARSIMEKDPDVTAIIGMTDIAAIAAIHAVHDCGRSVPGDISVIGFDDLPEAAYVIPSLTTVSQPIREIGEQAAQVIEAAISQRRGGEGETGDVVTRLPVRLVERQSTGPVRGSV
ncbi:LacI family DNA-binding transcriptional regulator [Rhizobium sp. C4]|uniref:LacI family DNA-binding transcriptional regulator n=1 Tax=Rhizobium sp. C4 TaxID=1349800 RepID=UPI001E4C1D8C|nr:LacI family DNA-binding transcriptional regulator [Rhizobium sp. C4]MCD2172430.1 LacI family transcriptional regulator [Rhizobium sp. C4]